jgi:hypothetical protein
MANPVTLETPITRGETEIKEVTLRKPGSGELRGINLTDLLQMNVNALHKVLPRISSPSLTEADVAKLDPADLTDMASEVAGFLLKKSPEA